MSTGARQRRHQVQIGAGQGAAHAPRSDDVHDPVAQRRAAVRATGRAATGRASADLAATRARRRAPGSGSHRTSPVPSATSPAAASARRRGATAGPARRPAPSCRRAGRRSRRRRLRIPGPAQGQVRGVALGAAPAAGEAPLPAPGAAPPTGASPAAAGSSQTVASSRCPKVCTPASRAVNGGVSAAAAASSGAARSKSDSGTKPKSTLTCGGQRSDLRIVVLADAPGSAATAPAAGSRPPRYGPSAARRGPRRSSAPAEAQVRQHAVVVRDVQPVRPWASRRAGRPPVTRSPAARSSTRSSRDGPAGQRGDRGQRVGAPGRTSASRRPGPCASRPRVAHAERRGRALGRRAVVEVAHQRRVGRRCRPAPRRSGPVRPAAGAAPSAEWSLVRWVAATTSGPAPVVHGDGGDGLVRAERVPPGLPYGQPAQQQHPAVVDVLPRRVGAQGVAGADPRRLAAACASSSGSTSWSAMTSASASAQRGQQQRPAPGGVDAVAVVPVPQGVPGQHAQPGPVGGARRPRRRPRRHPSAPVPGVRRAGGEERRPQQARVADPPAVRVSIRSTPVARSQTTSPSASTNSTRCHGMSPPGTNAGSGTRFGRGPALVDARARTGPGRTAVPAHPVVDLLAGTHQASSPSQGARRVLDRAARADVPGAVRLARVRRAEPVQLRGEHAGRHRVRAARRCAGPAPPRRPAPPRG